MEGHTETPHSPAVEQEGVVDLERGELLSVLREVQDGSPKRRVVDLDRRDLLSALRDVQDEPKRRPATVEDDNFLWLG